MTSADPHAAPRYPGSLRVVHLGLAVACLVAWASAQFAGDYKNPSHFGFTVHEWIGIGFTAILAVRVLCGFIGPAETRFANWFLFTASNLRLAYEDVRGLAGMRIPDRRPHEGLAGLVQGLGLLAFVVVAGTGTMMAAYMTPGLRATGWIHGVKEVHELAQQMIPVYLALHVGGAAMHALRGRSLWRSMFFLDRDAAKQRGFAEPR